MGFLSFHCQHMLVGFTWCLACSSTYKFLLPVWMHWCLLQTLQRLWRFVDRHQRLQYFPAPILEPPADPRIPSCPERVRLQCFGTGQVKTLVFDSQRIISLRHTWKNGLCDTVDNLFPYLKAVTAMRWATWVLTSGIPECPDDTG